MTEAAEISAKCIPHTLAVEWAPERFASITEQIRQTVEAEEGAPLAWRLNGWTMCWELQPR